MRFFYRGGEQGAPEPAAEPTPFTRVRQQAHNDRASLPGCCRLRFARHPGRSATMASVTTTQERRL